MLNIFYGAWSYLNNHPMFKDEYGYSKFQDCLDMNVVKVNPLTGRIDSDKKLNTKVVVWLECGKYENGETYHNIDLDCGADTFEDAIIELARLVKIKSE